MEQTTCNEVCPAILADIIRADWKAPYFGAVPYLDAMSTLRSVSDDYGCDSGKSIILYFLSNAQTWRGPIAREVKARLKQLVKIDEYEMLARR